MTQLISFVHVIRLICTNANRKKTQSVTRPHTHLCVWRHILICKTWLIHKCDMTQLILFVHVIRSFAHTQTVRRVGSWLDCPLIHACDMMYLCAGLDSFIRVKHDEIHPMLTRDNDSFARSHRTRSRFVTRLRANPYVWRDVFIYVTWLIHTCVACCNSSHSYMRHDSFADTHTGRGVGSCQDCALRARQPKLCSLNFLWTPIYTLPSGFFFPAISTPQSAPQPLSLPPHYQLACCGVVTCEG